MHRTHATIFGLAVSLLLLVAAPASAALVTNEIDLAITKAASTAEAAVGGAFSYTLGVVNNGPSTAPSVLVTDTLPANQAFVSAAASLGSCTHSGEATGGVVSCTLGSMDPAVPATITINVTMAAAPTDSLCSTNVASVTDTTDVVVVETTEITEITWPDSNLANNQASAEVCLPAPTDIDLELTKRVDQAVVSVGTPVLWTLTVTNQGPAAASGVTVSDNLPAEVTYVSDNGGGAYNSSSGIWTIGDLAVGASASLQITTTVDAPGVHLNVAQIAAADQVDIDSTPGNNVASEDDHDSAEVGTVLQAATTTTTTTVAPATTSADTLVKTGPQEQARNIGLAGLAALLIGIALVLAATSRDTAAARRRRYINLR